jgi:hypothetical protein
MGLGSFSSIATGLYNHECGDPVNLRTATASRKDAKKRKGRKENFRKKLSLFFALFALLCAFA